MKVRARCLPIGFIIGAISKIAEQTGHELRETSLILLLSNDTFLAYHTDDVFLFQRCRQGARRQHARVKSKRQRHDS